MKMKTKSSLLICKLYNSLLLWTIKGPHISSFLWSMHARRCSSHSKVSHSSFEFSVKWLIFKSIQKCKPLFNDVVMPTAEDVSLLSKMQACSCTRLSAKWVQSQLSVPPVPHVPRNFVNRAYYIHPCYSMPQASIGILSSSYENPGKNL